MVVVVVVVVVVVANMKCRLLHSNRVTLSLVVKIDFLILKFHCYVFRNSCLYVGLLTIRNFSFIHLSVIYLLQGNAMVRFKYTYQHWARGYKTFFMLNSGEHEI